MLSSTRLIISYYIVNLEPKQEYITSNSAMKILKKPKPRRLKGGVVVNQDKKQEQQQQQGRGGAGLLRDGGVVEGAGVSKFVPQHAVAEHDEVEGDDEEQRQKQQAESRARLPPLHPIFVV